MVAGSEAAVEHECDGMVATVDDTIMFFYSLCIQIPRQRSIMRSTTFVSVILLLACVAASSWPKADAHRHVPAIYVFGDSTSDVGNNNYLPGDDIKANFLPYGIDYPGGIPTGRFCNGYLGVDYTAMRIGFKKSPPAALSVETAAKESRGVNYASAGSGVLDQTGQNVSISLNTQIELFRKTVGRIRKARGKQHAHLLLAKSIFMFSTFSNDILGFFNQNYNAATNATLQDQFISSLTIQFRHQLETLHTLGARKMVVFGTGQLGCPPAFRLPSPTRDCLELLNVISQKFNIAMKETMNALSCKLKGLRYSYVNIYDIDNEVQERATEFGFKDIKSACCGSGLLNAETSCMPNSTYCSNRDAYLYWDFLHPTQATYKRFTELAYSSTPGFVEPINLDDLVRHFDG